MRYLTISCFVLLFAAGCKDRAIKINRSAIKAKVNRVLDDWHKAAAEGDFERYFNHFASDSSIFMGTDTDEYWTVPEFKEYARKPFESGSAWSFAPIRRHIYVSQTGQVVWFDEALASSAFGLARGSGVLVKADSTYKIAHYNLSLPIPNSIVYDLVDQMEEVRSNE